MFPVSLFIVVRLWASAMKSAGKRLRSRSTEARSWQYEVRNNWRRGQDSNLQALTGASFQDWFLTIRSTPPIDNFLAHHILPFAFSVLFVHGSRSDCRCALKFLNS